MTRAIALVLTLAPAAPLAAGQLPDHSGFAPVLSGYVHGGLVDYAGLQSDRTALDAYLDQLGRPTQAAIDAATHDQRLAFWINAYNACVLKLVVDHYPIEQQGGFAALLNKVKGYPSNSIQQIPDGWKGTFCTVAGNARSLDEIRNQILRAMGEPRVYFAIACGARSCPNLAESPFTAHEIDSQLDARVAAFVADPIQYQLERGDHIRLRVGKVLEWFAQDFGEDEDLVAFLLPYLPDGDREAIAADGSVGVAFLDFDWTLNDTAVFDASH
jgi:Protein of unknown function, DUF547